MKFAECQSLEEPLGEGVDYNLLWTYEPGLQQGVLLVALDAAAPATGYIAFGIPKTPGTMGGGSAIVVKANASAPAGKLHLYMLTLVEQNHSLNISNSPI